MPDLAGADEGVGGEESPALAAREERAAARETFPLESDEVAVYLLERWGPGE